jgi:hypothetical protein
MHIDDLQGRSASYYRQLLVRCGNTKSKGLSGRSQLLLLMLACWHCQMLLLLLLLLLSSVLVRPFAVVLPASAAGETLGHCWLG